MFGRDARASLLSEPGALAAELPCGSARAVPPRRGAMAVHIIEIDLGDVLLQTARSTPVALLGTPVPGDGPPGAAARGARGHGAERAGPATPLHRRPRRRRPVRGGQPPRLRLGGGGVGRRDRRRSAGLPAGRPPDPRRGSRRRSAPSCSAGPPRPRCWSPCDPRRPPIVPIAARLGMTKALPHGSICGRVEAMRSSGSCNTSTVSRRQAAGAPTRLRHGAVLPNTDSVCAHVRSWRALDCLRSGCGGVDGAAPWRARSRTCNISPAELTHGQIESGAFGAQRHARA